jgi:hypothetical protein
MEAAEVWSVLLGAMVALAGTLIAQWSSLAYQTRRQREVRWADFQRTTLLQVRDLLGELVEAKERATGIPYAHLGLADEWDPLPSVHPAAQAVSSLNFRLRLAAVGLEDDQLQSALVGVSVFAWVATVARTEEEEQDATRNLIQSREQALDLLGDQLRKLS